jgi:hypothetical protein
MFEVNWPDCPYDKYIMTNNSKYEGETFINLSVGTDTDWSSSLGRALGVLNSNGYDYVFTMVEDYFFAQRIDTLAFIDIVDSFTSVNGDFLRMYSVVNPRIREMVNPRFGKIENYIPYRQTCAFALWKISTLQSVLRNGESAWAFEKVGVSRGFKFEGFYAVRKNLFKTINLVIKGKVVPSELKRVQQFLPDVTLDRLVMGHSYLWASRFFTFFKFLLLNYLPTFILRRIYFDIVNRS